MSTLQSLRRTGRTTRMLEAAFAHALQQPRGHHTLVVVSSGSEASYLANQLGELADVAGRMPSIGVRRVKWGDPEFDWSAWPVRIPAGGLSRVFVDPHVLELRFGDILDLYHAWDAPITVAGGPPPLELAAPPLSTARPPRKIIL